MDSLHSNVVLDGELVIDTDPKTGQVGGGFQVCYQTRIHFNERFLRSYLCPARTLLAGF